MDKQVTERIERERSHLKLSLSQIPSDQQDIQLITYASCPGDYIVYLFDILFRRLTHVETLFIRGSKYMSKLPNSIEDLTTLSKLIIRHNSLTELPESMGKLPNLKHMSICGSYKKCLTKLPEWVYKSGSIKIIIDDWMIDLFKYSMNNDNTVFVRGSKMVEVTDEINKLPPYPSRQKSARK